MNESILQGNAMDKFSTHIATYIANAGLIDSTKYAHFFFFFFFFLQTLVNS